MIGTATIAAMSTSRTPPAPCLHARAPLTELFQGDPCDWSVRGGPMVRLSWAGPADGDPI